MKAIILGATGAVGQALVKELVAKSKYEEVRAITRRNFTFPVDSPKFTQKVIDFSNIGAHASELQGFDAVFVAMGTTKASAGGAEQFIKIDQDLTVQATKAAVTPGLAQHILYVSSSSASESSPILYVKSKGQTERRLRELGASTTTIFRPGFLELEQSREVSRLAERLVGPVISKFRYLGIRSMSAKVTEVAEAMRRVAENDVHGEKVGELVSNAQILALCSS